MRLVGGRPICRVGPDGAGRIGLVQYRTQASPIMGGCIGHGEAPHEAMRTVDTDANPNAPMAGTAPSAVSDAASAPDNCVIRGVRLISKTPSLYQISRTSRHPPFIRGRFGVQRDIPSSGRDAGGDSAARQSGCSAWRWCISTIRRHCGLALFLSIVTNRITLQPNIDRRLNIPQGDYHER